MKKIALSLFVAVLSIICLTGCEKKPADMIIGKFKLVDISTDRPIPPDELEFYQENNAELISSSWDEFNKDSSLVSCANGVVKKGMWQLLGDGKQLKYTYEGNSTVIKEVFSLTDSELITTEKDNEGYTTTLKYTKE
ncbi:MAG: hypothetical protein MJZ61_04655 [Bacteroidales bacterium]|nr:hypothetical protein [Bacteroidales bacterium]